MDNLEIRQAGLYGLLALALVAELTWAARGGRGAYDLKDSLSNVSIAVANNAMKPVTLVWKYAVLAWVADRFQFFSLTEALPEAPWAVPLAALATFLVVDCAYYWYHRLNHEVAALWTMHHTHHSSTWMNLTTAVRLNWMANFISPLFFAPLMLLGLSPEWVATSLAIGLFYQFFLHTQAVPALGWFEGKLLNTPSAHRVHHGSNPIYIDKNYAGALIVWDRLFGTYQAEVEPVRYGVTTGFVGHNPLVIQLAPLWKLLHRDWKREKHLARGEGAR